MYKIKRFKIIFWDERKDVKCFCAFKLHFSLHRSCFLAWYWAVVDTGVVYRMGCPGNINWTANFSTYIIDNVNINLFNNYAITSNFKLLILLLQASWWQAFLKSTNLGPLEVWISTPSWKAEWINLTTTSMSSVPIPLLIN